MNFFNSKNKFFLDISKAKMMSKCVVFIDDTLEKLRASTGQLIQIGQVKNPFEEVAHPLVLKGALKNNIVANPNNSFDHKEYFCDDLVIISDYMPPKIQIKHLSQEDSDKVIKAAREIIEFTGIEKSVSRVGINYEMFLEETRNIKDYLLKDSVAKGFTSLSATPVFEIDENTTLNLTIAAAINNEGKNGIYFQANFDSKVSELNKIFDILNKNFRQIADDKINSIFG